MTKFLFSLVFCFLTLGLVPSSYAESYYDQFLHDGYCPKAETSFFHQLASVVEPIIGQDENGFDIVPSIQLQLFSDGTYFVKYIEWERKPNSPSGSAPQSSVKSRESTWHVKGTTLVLNGLGVGEPQQLNGESVIAFTLTTLMVSPEALNSKFILAYRLSNQGPRNACN